MAYQVTALYDQESGEAPLKWGKNAVAEGEFSANAGRVMVDDVLCTPVSWTASEVVFVPVASSRPDGNYSVHFDNEPLVLAFVTHPQDQTISATAPANEYLHDFTTKDIGAWTHTRASVATAPDESGVIQTYASGEPAWYRDQGLQLEDTRTNEALHSTDWSNAVWAKTGITPSGTQLTATTGNATILQTITGASAARANAFDIHRVSGSGTVEITGDGGSTWTAAAITGTSQRFSVQATQTNPVVGIRIVASGDVIEASWVNAEAGNFHTSRISTVASPVTRSATTCTATFAELGDPLPAGGFTNNFCGQLRFRFLADPADQVGNVFLQIHAGNQTNGIRLDLFSETSMRTRIYYGGSLINMYLDVTGKQTGDVVDYRFRHQSGLNKVWDATTGDTGTNAGDLTFSAAVDEVSLMYYNGNLKNYITVEKVLLVPEALSDAEIEAWT